MGGLCSARKVAIDLNILQGESVTTEVGAVGEPAERAGLYTAGDGAMERPDETSAAPLVALPWDVPRVNEPQVLMATVPCALPVLDQQRATVLAAVAATLFRYAHQDAITLLIRGAQGAGLVPWTVSPTARMSARALCTLAADALSSIDFVQGNGPARPSNVVVDFAPSQSMGELLAVDLYILCAAEPQLGYNSRLFSSSTALRLAGNLARLCAALQVEPACCIADLPLLGAEELRIVTATEPAIGALAALGTGAETGADALQPVHAQVEVHCRETPHAIAASCRDVELSYGELGRLAERWASYLRAQGVSSGAAVGVCLRPRVEQVVMMLAVFRLGAVYVPLDPTHPASLVAHMLAQATPSLVVTEEAVSAATASAACPRLFVDREQAGLAACDGAVLDEVVSLDHRCYLLFTSGTTGQPKGVTATHRNLAHYLQVARLRYGFGPGDVFSSIARYTFSISMFELLSPLCCGGTVRLLPREHVLDLGFLARELQAITVLHAGPSLLSSLFRYLGDRLGDRSGDGSAEQQQLGSSFPRMRHASSGGDVVAPHVMEGMKRVFPNAELFVIYGSTEVSCMACTFAIPRTGAVARSYVGRPFAAVLVRVLDPQLSPVPIGAVGQICVAGPGVVPGYLHRPELTAERFVELEGHRYYQTGDLGRFDEAGNIEILGRNDFQVQIRGMRVELVGIENTIRRLGLAEQCAVVVKHIGDHDTRLVAFLVASHPPDPQQARALLAAHLPDYMLPQHFVDVVKLPLTANGKLDRRALSELPFRPHARAQPTSAAPRSALEKKLCDAFCEALGVSQVGLDENFFDLGGHSLLALLVGERIENKLGMTVHGGALFEAPTVRALAQHLQDSQQTNHRPILLSGDARKPAVFLIAAVHLYRELAQRLQSDYSIYAVYASVELSVLSVGIGIPPVAALAAQYIEVIRRQQPHGPYRLAGLSFGGIVTYEVAQQLRASGEQVLFVGLFDSVLPEPGMRGRFAKVGRLLRLPRARVAQLIAERVGTRLRGWTGGRRVAKYGRFSAGKATGGSATQPASSTERKMEGMELQREQAYHVAAASYAARVQDWPAPVTLFAAGRRLAAEPLRGRDCGWGRHIGQLQTHVIDAEHLDLLVAPHVDQVAQAMLRALGRATE